MTFPNTYEPPIEVWVIPSDDVELQPKPALLYKETEHEIVVSEYSGKDKAFQPTTRERRAKAYRLFEECRVAMLGQRAVALEAAKSEARNQASIYNHILSMAPQPFPHEQAEALLGKAQPKEEAQEKQEKEVAGKGGATNPAIQRPAARRRS